MKTGILFVFMFICTVLQAIVPQAELFVYPNRHHMPLPDVFAPNDTIKADPAELLRQKNTYEDFRLRGYKILIPEINPFTMKINLLYLDYQELAQNDLYILSQELYNDFYKCDIMLWNFSDAAYLNMNLSDLQNSRGLIRLNIPLSNLSQIFKGKLRGSPVDKTHAPKEE